LVGGVKRIASVTEKLVPVMAIFYILGSIVILAFNFTKLPQAFWLIIKYAFVPESLIGGGFGYALKTALSQGAKRGLFSNEAGMGTTPHAHALADAQNPHKQGTVAIVSVFLDTFVVLSLTALVIISSLYTNGGALETGAIPNGVSNTNLVAVAITNAFGGGNVASTISAYFIAICLMFFAFSTIIGWNLFGRTNFEYLFGKKAIIIFVLISSAFVFLGTMLKSDLVWELTDFFNYLMVIPNVLALFKLNKSVIDEIKENGPQNKKLYS
jgi:AGCS family alanine or glycine:cation symporter